MEQQIGPLVADVWHGESERFTAPMLLVHGLWDSADAWRRFAGFLGHRGWHCIAPHLRGRRGDEPAGRFEEHLSDLRAVIVALDARPVIIGHDLGALLALHTASAARAVVALSPLVPLPVAAQPPAALARAGNWWQRWRGRARSAPAGRWRGEYPAHGLLEPAALLRQLGEEPFGGPRAAGTPALVLAGEADRVTPLEAARALAERAGAELLVCAESGHGLPVDANWKRTVSIVHRWIIQRLGAALLELYEEEPEER
jgi:pimeloyl-ACP methyl ester carboxylesterase